MSSTVSHPKSLLFAALDHAKSMKVHRRQCCLLCLFVQRATATPSSPVDANPEASQQWDEVLNNIYDCLSAWVKFDLVESFFLSEKIEHLIDNLFAELQFCGLKSNDAYIQLMEKRQEDRASLQESLRTIASRDDFRSNLLTQTPDRIIYFIKALQSAVKQDYNSATVLWRLEEALMFLYKNAEVDIPIPDLSSQISNINPSPARSSAITHTFHGLWLESEVVFVKRIRRLQTDTISRKRFRRDVWEYYSIRHPNIVRVYGMVADRARGCCIITPSTHGENLLAYLDRQRVTSVLPILHDIVFALHYLHSREIIHGDLRAENILIREDGTACLSDFGLVNLAGGFVEIVEEYIRWFAPEIIRAVTAEQPSGSEVKSMCDKCTDIYSLGMVMYEAFTSEAPFGHLQDTSMLKEEIPHGMRPSIATNVRPTAIRRGWNTDMNKLMKECWDADPSKRPTSTDVATMIQTILEQSGLSWSVESIQSRPSSFTPSVYSGKLSDYDFPQTPRTLNPSSPIIASSNRSSSSQGHFFDSDRALPESVQSHNNISPVNGTSGSIAHLPSPIHATSSGAQRKMSSTGTVSSGNTSEQTIRPLPRSSFSSDSDNEGHLGGEYAAYEYERMPKLRPPSLSSKRRGSKDRFNILVAKMTEGARVNANWVGVANMESLRSLPRSKLRQIKALEVLVEKETQFLAGVVNEDLSRRLRADPSILGADRLESFLSNLFEDSHMLREINSRFRNALYARPDVANVGFAQVALLCKEAGSQFADCYPAYVRHLPEVKKLVADEIDTNDRFARLMREKLPGGVPYRQSLENFLIAPVAHLENHPVYLQSIRNEMQVGDPDRPALDDAIREMWTAVLLTRLSSWQQGEAALEWTDLVAPEVVRAAPRTDVSRQTTIFKLISEERTYVKDVKTLKLKVLQRLSWDIANLKRKELAPVQETIKGLIAVCNDFLRFHGILLENFFTIQRSDYPFVGAFVSQCGVDRIPWFALYDSRYGTLYRKLSDFVQESRSRPTISSILKRVIQEALKERNEDFMTFLQFPSKHLRSFVGLLRTIFELTQEDNEDRNVISELMPRLLEISTSTEMKTSASEEHARLSSLAASLDFSKFPGIEADIEISSSNRTLLCEGKLNVSVRSASGRAEEYYAILLDHYFILADQTEEHGMRKLNVRPLPLELLSLKNFEDLPDLPSGRPRNGFPCCSIEYSGFPQKDLFLFAESESISQRWLEKIKDALTRRRSWVAANQTMQLQDLHRFAKAPSCSAEFVHDGQPILVIGCEVSPAGVWIKRGNESPRLAAPMTGITSMTIVTELNLILVLAERCLYWFRLDDLLNTNKTPHSHAIDDSKSVQFYRAGSLPEKVLLVLSAKRKGKNVLRFYEASERGRQSSGVFGAMRSRSGPFSNVTDAEILVPIKDVFFLRSRIVLVTTAFQLVDYGDSESMKDSILAGRQVLPFPNDTMTEIVERCQRSTPVALHRFDNDFILCYSDFATYMNTTGNLSAKIVEWESKEVQNIVFRTPYMYLIGRTTMEVREIATGRLAQLLPAPNIKLSWEGRATDGNPSNLNVHVIVAEKASDPSSDTRWLSLESPPHTLFRIHRR